jgi:hypothetical protein
LKYPGAGDLKIYKFSLENEKVFWTYNVMSILNFYN